MRNNDAMPGPDPVDIVREHDIRDWSFRPAEPERRALQQSLERGEVLYFPRLDFALLPQEREFLDPHWSDGKAKNISLRPADGSIRGTAADPDHARRLRDMIARYSASSEGLLASLFPGYVRHWRRGQTSYRPRDIALDKMSWRKDDTRLHVDSFPSNPVHGQRLLRVFSNVHPLGGARVWSVGEPFRNFAAKFLPRTRPPVPGSAWLMQTLGITKQRRSEYDHLMLQLHDRVKADLDYQRNAPRQIFAFPPGSTWIVFTDQVLHAASAGQFAFENTFYLDPRGLDDPDTSPLAMLESLTGRKLVAS